MKDQFYHFKQPDLQLIYKKEKNCDTTISKYQYYYVLILISGSARVEYPDKICYLTSGQTLIANNFEQFKVHIKSKNTEFVEIRFNSNFFREIDDKIDLLRAFSHSQKEQIKIFDAYQNSQNYRFAVSNIIRALASLQSRGVVLSAVLGLVCELYYMHQQSNPPQIKETDSSFAKLYNYIMDHLFEKLTIESVARAVFLSPRSVTNILRRISNMSFLEFVTHERLKHAKVQIDSGTLKLNQVAKNCGFENYCTFFRVFTKEFGVSPSEYIKNKKPKL